MTVARGPLLPSVVAVAVLSALVARTDVAGAQTASGSELALSREQFDIGVRAATAGRWPAAAAAFERAYQLVPQPLILLNLASSQVESGHLVEGAERYRQFLRAATEGPARARRTDAERALAAVEARMPHARLALAGLGAADQVVLDDRTLGRAALGVPLPVDPGHHVLRVRRDGAVVAATEFDVAEGGLGVVSLRAPTAPTPRPRRLPASPTAQRGLLAEPWFWTVVGVVALGAGATAVVLAVQPGAGPSGNFDPPVLRL